MTNCTTCPVNEGYKPAEALQQIGEPVEALRLADTLEEFAGYRSDFEAAAELRRQHARIAELEAELSKEKAISEELGAHIRKGIEAKLAAVKAAPAPAAVEPTQRVTVDFKQATDMLKMFGGEPSSVTLGYGNGHSGNGLYASYTDMPEEGSHFLGETDSDAAPRAQDVQDAVRYRWLRDKANDAAGGLGVQRFNGSRFEAIVCDEHLDDAIDAAIAAAQKGE